MSRSPPPKLSIKQPNSTFYDQSSTSTVQPLDSYAYNALRPDLHSHRPRLGVQAKILLPTVVVFIATAGLGIALNVWLFSRNTLSTTEVLSFGYILADEGTKSENGMESARLRALTLTSFISTFINATSPVLMLLVSYHIAHSWIETQIHPGGNSTDARPTPIQYGILVEVLGSPSILSLSTAVYYLFRRGSRAAAPPYFVKAVALGVIVYLITHLVGIVDLWLHTATSAVMFNLPAYGPLSINASFELNHTLCPWVDPTQLSINSCSSSESWFESNTEILLPAYRVVSNSSADRRVITLKHEDDLAVVVPDITNQSVTLDTSSVGVHAQCKSLSDKQSECNNTRAAVNCSNIGISVIPSEGIAIRQGGKAPNLVLSNKPFNRWTDPPYKPDKEFYRPPPCCIGNPAESVVQLNWEFAAGNFMPQLNPALVTFPPTGPVRLYARCDLTVYNVTLSYNGSARNGTYWTLRTKTLSDMYFADTILGAYAWNLISDQAAQNVKSRAMSANSAEEVMGALSQELSRLALGMGSALLSLNPPTNVQAFNPTILGRYPLIPLILFSILLFIYGLLALAIFGTSFTMRSDTVVFPQSLQDRKSSKSRRGKDKSILTLELVRLRFTSPIPAFVQFFGKSPVASKPPGPDDPDARSVSQSIIGMLDETGTSNYTEARLRFGLENTEVRPRFGVWIDQVDKD